MTRPTYFSFLHVMELLLKKERQERVQGLTEKEICQYFQHHYNLSRRELYTITGRLRFASLLTKKRGKFKLTKKSKKILESYGIISFLDKKNPIVTQIQQKAERRRKVFLNYV